LFGLYGRVAATGQAENKEIFVAALKEWFWISVYSPKPGVFVAVFDVITQRKQAEARIARLGQLKDALSDCSHAIVKATDENALFREICEIIVARAGFLFAWVGLADREHKLVQPAASGGPLVDYLAALRVSLDESEAEGRGAIAEAVRAGRIVISQDFVNDPRKAPWRALAERWGIGSMAAIPLRRGGEVIGSLNVYARETGTFDQEIVSLLLEMASDISFAVEVIKRDRELVQARERLELATRGSGLAVWEWANAEDPSSFWWSPGIFEMLGYHEGELETGLGSILAITHPDDGQRLLKAAREALDTGATQEVQIRVRTKQGKERWYSIRGQRLAGATGGASRLVGTFDDIDEQKQSEIRLRESEERFRAIIEQSISGICMIDVDGRFSYVNPRLASILGYESGDLLVGRRLIEFVAPESHAVVRNNLRERLAGQMQHARYQFEAMRKDGARITLGAHGVLGIYRGQRAVITTVQDVTELRRAEEEVERTVVKLKRAVQSTIEVVSTIGELRDPYTHGHERRVGEIATSIAAELRLPADFIEGIRVAGYLHDVGKIAVPAEILSKPSRLSKAEFDLVKQHAQQSYDILKGVEFPWPVAEAAWQHHERMDGSGYPRGLKGDQIILEARILAVADTVEAMSSHRPYRPGLGIEAALAEIEKNGGRTFDAQAVDGCLRLFREKGYTIPA
jgi:PAS domain S-box-containing protein